MERHQLWLYLAAIAAGLAIGTALPGLSAAFETLLWPVLGLLLYTTFIQVPLAQIPLAFRDTRFLGAVLIGNFLLVPLLVWGLSHLLPDDPAIRLGVLLVLLVPCTDWFISFTHLGGGDTRRAIAATPVNLVAQIVLLPLYLWLFMGDGLLGLVDHERVALAFVALILLPLFAAWVTSRIALRITAVRPFVVGLRVVPIPLLASVILMIAASQVEAVLGALPVFRKVAFVFLAFLVIVPVIAIGLARALRLSAMSTRTLVFSLATRNSFVVLPIAVALGPGWEIAIVVIVFQSLVELLAMIAYLRLVPRFVPES